MIPNEGITELCNSMLVRQQGTAPRTRDTGTSGPGPYTLFIGAACSRAAGVPSVDEIARQVFDDLFEHDPETARAYVPEAQRSDRAAPTSAFYQLLGALSNLERYSLLQSFYEDHPVPLFYQDLSRLVQAGFFRTILTTSYDTLLEQALTGVGGSSLARFRVVNLGANPEKGTGPSLPGNQLTIVKLHGDIAQSGQLVVTPDEIERSLGAQRSFIEGQLSQDLMVVGYEFESPPVTDWLAWSSREVWWVSPKRPLNDAMGRIAGDREVHFVDGEAAQPELFFGQLTLRLLTLSATPSRPVEPNSFSFSTTRQTTESLVGDDEALRLAYLQDQLQRAKEVLVSLENDASANKSGAAAQTQIDYQRARVARLEDLLRAQSATRPRIAELANQITSAVQKAELDPKTRSYVESQASVIRSESALTEPNQDILSAAISATLVVAERLGDRVVGQDVVQALGAFATSLTRRA